MLKKNGLTYTSLSQIQTKENLFLLIPLQHENFYVDPRIHIEMKTIALEYHQFFNLKLT